MRKRIRNICAGVIPAEISSFVHTNVVPQTVTVRNAMRWKNIIFFLSQRKDRERGQRGTCFKFHVSSFRRFQRGTCFKFHVSSFKRFQRVLCFKFYVSSFRRFQDLGVKVLFFTSCEYVADGVLECFCL